MSISLACPTVGQDERPRTPNRQDSDNDTVYSSDYEAQEGSSSPSRRGMEGRWFTVDIWPWHIHGTLYFSFLFKVKLLVLVEWWQLCNMSWGCPGSGYVEVTSFSGSETINSPSIPQYNRCNLWTSQPMVGWWSMLMVYSSSNPLLEWWHGDWPSKPPTLPINQPFTLKCQWTPRISTTGVVIWVRPAVSLEWMKGTYPQKRSSVFMYLAAFYDIQLKNEIFVVWFLSWHLIQSRHSVMQIRQQFLRWPYIQYLLFVPFCGANENLSPEGIQSSQWCLFVTKLKHVLSIFE